MSFKMRIGKSILINSGYVNICVYLEKFRLLIKELDESVALY